MKKLLATLVLILFLSGTAFAAGSSFKVIDDHVMGGGTMRVIKLSYVGDDAAGTVPDLTITNNTWTDGTATGTLPEGSLTTWYAYKMEFAYGSTPITADSDITVKQNGVDLLDGNGTDKVDDNTYTQAYFACDGLGMPQPIIAPITIAITNESDVDAIGNIWLILVKK